MRNWLKNKLIQWICADLDERISDIERHFVTRRDKQGVPIETLANVSLEERRARRKRLAGRMSGMTWQQRQAFLEATEGGSQLPEPEVQHG